MRYILKENYILNLCININKIIVNITMKTLILFKENKIIGWFFKYHRHYLFLKKIILNIKRINS